ncbi:MAG: leucine-rich repeat protein [Oscillospiraceae bacterium]|nr:leucine-rich repeat protein [Oscillospiraceae bacterium]
MKFKITVISIAAVLLIALVIFFAMQYTPSNILNYVRAANLEIDDGVLTVPAEYTVIEPGAFNGRIEFNTVIIEGETDIGSRAFYNCTSLSRVVIRESCDIGDEAFADCPMLKEIEVLSPGGSCADNAFNGHSGAVVSCYNGSEVWEVARRADMSVIEMD